MVTPALSGDAAAYINVDPVREGTPRHRDDHDLPPCVLKILVTNNIAGGLIGKKGGMINEMQRQSGARIKLSQANDFFPGTQAIRHYNYMTRILTQTMTLDHLCVSARNSERTVLLCGEKEAVMHAQELVLQRVQQDPWTRAGTYGTSTPDLILARIVVPAASAGAIIGRQGSNINALKEQTGAHIKLVRKEESAVPNERLVNIQGSLGACVQVVNALIYRMIEEPELARYQNMTTSYSRMMAVMSQAQAALEEMSYDVGGIHHSATDPSPQQQQQQQQHRGSYYHHGQHQQSLYHQQSSQNAYHHQLSHRHHQQGSYHQQLVEQLHYQSHAYSHHHHQYAHNYGGGNMYGLHQQQRQQKRDHQQALQGSRQHESSRFSSAVEPPGLVQQEQEREKLPQSHQSEFTESLSVVMESMLNSASYQPPNRNDHSNKRRPMSHHHIKDSHYAVGTDNNKRDDNGNTGSINEVSKLTQLVLSEPSGVMQPKPSTSSPHSSFSVPAGNNTTLVNGSRPISSHGGLQIQSVWRETQAQNGQHCDESNAEVSNTLLAQHQLHPSDTLDKNKKERTVEIGEKTEEIPTTSLSSSGSSSDSNHMQQACQLQRQHRQVDAPYTDRVDDPSAINDNSTDSARHAGSKVSGTTRQYPYLTSGRDFSSRQQHAACVVQLAVPDNLIPCILGPKGATLHDLMAYSGANIKISQRNEVIPGTTNRIVTCTGAAQATQAAQFLISQRIQMALQQVAQHYRH